MNVQIMFNSIVLGIKGQRYRRYSEAFNFFQSKSINMIIGNRKLEYVVHYRDLQFLDDETEYFKRYYGTTETSTRIKKLINYYEINMTAPAPNLLPIHNYHILETRTRKLIKLCIMREKSIAKRSIVHEQLDDEDDQDNMILSQLNNSNYSAPSSAKEEDSDAESFDSQPHNAYQSDRPSPRNKSIEDLNLREHPDFLILEFRMPEEPPKINILPPPPPPVPEKVTVSVAVQTLPVEAPLKKSDRLDKKEVQREREKEREKQKQRDSQKQKERLKQQGQREEQGERSREQKERIKARSPIQGKSPLLSDGLGIRTDIKNDYVILTQSIDMRGVVAKEEKKKASTFMEYYNSIPVKNPTNILEKYLKRRK